MRERWIRHRGSLEIPLAVKAGLLCLPLKKQASSSIAKNNIHGNIENVTLDVPSFLVASSTYFFAAKLQS